MANHYSFNNFGKVADPNEYKTINKKSLFSTMYEKVLKGIDIDVAFVTIDELNKNRYKTTVMFPNGYSDYYYSNDLCSEETAIKNIENMRNSYIKMEQEIEQNEQDMEMEIVQKLETIILIVQLTIKENKHNQTQKQKWKKV